MFKLQRFLKLFFSPGSPRPQKGKFQIHSDDFLPEGEDNLRLIYFAIVSLFQDDEIFLNPDISLGDVARMVGTNTSYVTRAIQQYTDVDGFCDYLNLQRINYAKRLLLSQKKTPVAKLALKSGYNSEANFNKNFRKYEKTSPAKWRDAHSAASTALK